MANSEDQRPDQRKNSGRPFAKGKSGNPKGRPPRVDHAFNADSFENLISAVGVSGFDRRLETTFVADIIVPEIAQQLWRGNDIAGRVISEPAQEALREGFEIEVADDPDASDALGARLEESGAFAAVTQAIEFARAYGGGAIFPVINDGSADLSQPLRTDAIRVIENLVVLEPRELTPLRYYTDVRHPKYRRPEMWQLQPLGTAAQGLATTAIHESRLAYFDGIRVSNDPNAHNLQGHGDSVLTRLWAVLRDFGSAWDSTGLLVQDWQTTMWKIKDLALMVAQDKTGAFKGRMNAAQLSKSMLRAIMIDADGESFERSTANATGLPEILDRYGGRLSAAAGGFPLTRLLGISPAGLNATGEGDTRNWYDFCGRVRASYTKPAEELAKFYTLEIAGPTKGKEPELWSVCWPPLWQESAKEKADTAKVVADTDTAYIATGVFSADEVRKARTNAEDGYMAIEDDGDEAVPTAEEIAGLRTPGGVPPPTSGMPAAGLEPAKTAFTGVQVSALIEVVKAAGAKEIARESAQAILELAFPVSKEQATAILGPEDFEPTKPEPPPSPFGSGPPKPPGAVSPADEKPAEPKPDLGSDVPKPGMPPKAKPPAREDSVAGAREELQAAIERHERHMNGTEATDKESQQKMMDEMKRALAELVAPEDKEPM